jgi:eight transmembrane protein EpsH (proposed exosortase)
LSQADRLAPIVLSFVLLVQAAGAMVLGRTGMRGAAFPLLFLLFMVPLPAVVEHGFTAFLQHASAETAYFLIKMSGLPILREGTLFQLPGINMEVAPECSGIRSTMVLILTSFLAGHLFLKRIWTRSALVAAVIVLGILRNGFRILVLAQLCVQISPTMIDSPIHHRGGPVFFALSLIPLLALIWYFRKIEKRSPTPVGLPKE